LAVTVANGASAASGRAPARQAARSGTLVQLERLLGLTLTGMAGVVVVVGGWVLAYLIGGRALYILVYCGVILIGVSVGIARRKREVAAERSELPKRMREGQSAEVELTLSSRRRLNAFVAEERLHPLLGSAVRIPVASIGPGLELRHRYTLKPILRGVYRIGPLYAEWTDPLGLARKEQLLLPADEVVVHPSTELVYDRPLTRMWEDPPIRPPISKPWPQGFEFYGMRDYVRGDDIRRIVWRAVARTGKLMVRESEQGITDKVMVVIDTDGAWHSPGEPSETFELAVRVAASLGVLHIKDGFSVSLQTNEADLAASLRGPRARIGYLDHLARLRRGKQPLATAIERLIRGQHRDLHVIVITPHLDSATASRIRLMIDHGVSVLVATILWEESDPNTVRRAQEIEAQVVQVKLGAPLATVFANSLGAGKR
jgi:uncharacterized protein (DUF58 family)